MRILRSLLAGVALLGAAVSSPDSTVNAQQKSGLSAEDIVEGTLVSMGDKWMVMKDGTCGNRIPRDKVLFLRVSR